MRLTLFVSAALTLAAACGSSHPSPGAPTEPDSSAPGSEGQTDGTTDDASEPPAHDVDLPVALTGRSVVQAVERVRLARLSAPTTILASADLDAEEHYALQAVAPGDEWLLVIGEDAAGEAIASVAVPPAGPGVAAPLSAETTLEAAVLVTAEAGDLDGRWVMGAVDGRLAALVEPSGAAELATALKAAAQVHRQALSQQAGAQVDAAALASAHAPVFDALTVALHDDLISGAWLSYRRDVTTAAAVAAGVSPAGVAVAEAAAGVALREALSNGPLGFEPATAAALGAAVGVAAAQEQAVLASLEGDLADDARAAFATFYQQVEGSADVLHYAGAYRALAHDITDLAGGAEGELSVLARLTSGLDGPAMLGVEAVLSIALSATTTLQAELSAGAGSVDPAVLIASAFASFGARVDLALAAAAAVGVEPGVLDAVSAAAGLSGGLALVVLDVPPPTDPAAETVDLVGELIEEVVGSEAVAGLLDLLEHEAVDGVLAQVFAVANDGTLIPLAAGIVDDLGGLDVPGLPADTSQALLKVFDENGDLVAAALLEDLASGPLAVGPEETVEALAALAGLEDAGALISGPLSAAAQSQGQVDAVIEAAGAASTLTDPAAAVAVLEAALGAKAPGAVTSLIADAEGQLQNATAAVADLSALFPTQAQALEQALDDLVYATASATTAAELRAAGEVFAAAGLDAVKAHLEASYELDLLLGPLVATLTGTVSALTATLTATIQQAGPGNPGAVGAAFAALDANLDLGAAANLLGAQDIAAVDAAVEVIAKGLYGQSLP